MVPKGKRGRKGREICWGKIIWSLNKGGTYLTVTNIWHETRKEKKTNIWSENRKGNMWSEGRRKLRKIFGLKRRMEEKKYCWHLERVLEFSIFLLITPARVPAEGGKPVNISFENKTWWSLKVLYHMFYLFDLITMDTQVMAVGRMILAKSLISALIVSNEGR